MKRKVLNNLEFKASAVSKIITMYVCVYIKLPLTLMKCSRNVGMKSPINARPTRKPNLIVIVLNNNNKLTNLENHDHRKAFFISKQPFDSISPRDNRSEYVRDKITEKTTDRIVTAAAFSIKA